MATRPFFDALREIRRGEILDDCSGSGYGYGDGDGDGSGSGSG